MEFIRKFMQEESGATAAEYGIIVGTIGALLIGGLVFFYQEMGTLFSSWGTWFSTGSAPPR
jgi:Flp pilus assembly pilin Flp